MKAGLGRTIEAREEFHGKKQAGGNAPTAAWRYERMKDS